MVINLCWEVIRRREQLEPQSIKVDWVLLRLNDWKGVGCVTVYVTWLKVQSIPLRQGGSRNCDWERGLEEMPGYRCSWYYKVDVGSSYHCEAEFTKRWIVHPLNDMLYCVTWWE